MRIRNGQEENLKKFKKVMNSLIKLKDFYFGGDKISNIKLLFKYKFI